MNHLPVLAIVLPLASGAVQLLAERSGLLLQRAISVPSVLLLIVMSVALAIQADTGMVQTYRIGAWPAHLGIALAVDRLSVIMLTTTAILALCALLYAMAGHDRRAPHFHALFQFQLAGLNGAFLTADLFNLFVFFEVLLIASYGLLLSGGRGLRLHSGLHYIAFNIAASALFLIAVALLYGVLGALNMAELAERIRVLAPENVRLVRAAGGLLLVVFCAKAALAPLYLWLPRTYAAAPAAVAALFVVMTKLGVYAVLRVYTLLFGAEAGEVAGLAWSWLLPAGAITLLLASAGALAARHLRQLAAYWVVASAATLFIALALARPAAIGAGLYYLVQSSFAAAALFLIAGRLRQPERPADGSWHSPYRARVSPFLGIAFLFVAMTLVGLPPLPGFIAKFSLLSAMGEAEARWLWPLLLGSGLLALLAFSRIGIRLFWRSNGAQESSPSHSLRAIEMLPVVLLLAFTIGLSVFAAPALRYATAAADQLLMPADYIGAVLFEVPPGEGETVP